MTQYIEDFLPPIMDAGLNTQENVSIGGTLTVTGAQTFTGNTVLSGTLSVTGATTLAATLAVTGASTFTGLATGTTGFTTPRGYAALNTATTTTGGVTTAGFTFGSGPLLGIYTGFGAPTIPAPVGSLYLRTDGSTTVTRMYISTNAVTSWTAVTTVV